MTIRLVLVGSGWAGKFHAEAARRHPQAEIAAIVDENEESARRLAEQIGNAAVFHSVEQLFESGIEFDGGMVCTLPATHISISEAFINRGKHVLCEKPMGREPDRIAGLIPLALERRVKVGLNCNQRFSPTMQQLKRLIETEKVHMIRITMHQNGPKIKTDHTYDYHVVSDACCHMIDSLTFLNGEIESVHAFGQRLDSEILSDVTVNVRFANGSIGTMTHTYVGSEHRPGQHPFQQLDLSTERARYTVDNLMDRLSIFPHKELCYSTWSPSIFEQRDYGVTMYGSVFGWIDSIAGDTSVPVDLQTAFRNAKVAKACIASVESGEVVRLEYGHESGTGSR